MNVKIEVLSSIPIRKLEQQVERALEQVPAEHLRGFAKIVFVDTITEPKLSAAQRSSLPSLYHPKMGGSQAWGEVAVSIILPKKKLSERLMSRLTLKPNISQVVLSLVAQHYHFTLGARVKKNELERACRSYVEKYFEKWRESQGGIRMKLMKPFRPTLDRWAKKLSKKARESMEREKKRA